MQISSTGKPGIAGISGGETSALLATMCDSTVLLCFQNTGREAAKTYGFLERLSEHLQGKLVCLEYRPPVRKGDQPCESRFEVVPLHRLNKTGEPFELLMEALNAYRSTKGKGKIAPWARSRLCTTYLKTRTARAYVKSLNWQTWNEYVGLRADEPNRVARLRSGVPSYIGRFAPLFDFGITKADVRSFWDKQAFKLDLDPLMGNCTGCFLKDQADLSRALAVPETDANWWIQQETRYPGWGGRDFATYSRLLAESSARQRIEQTLRSGSCPVGDIGIPNPRRFRLVLIQEQKRLERGAAPFSCGCEGSQTMAELDTEQEEEYLLSLPGDVESVAVGDAEGAKGHVAEHAAGIGAGDGDAQPAGN